ncbi:MAG TPA: iron-binding protein [Sulfuricurvum sp.]|nr:iron-binding protein [Sulfuricurvum sp.]
MTSEIFQLKHELWLQTLFASFAIEDPKIKDELYDFALIEFRHLRWIARELFSKGKDYSYDRSRLLYKSDSTFEPLRLLITEIKKTMELYPATALSARMITDEHYLISRLASILENPDNNKAVTAFNMHRTLPGKTLDQTQLDAMTLFLFEESYKEYELILVYAYMQNKSSNITEHDIYQDLIDESQFHLKSFGNLMAKMGILALPRELHEHTYKIDDVETFIRNGIDEEENAKEQCRELAGMITDKELSEFFDFINFQESYHIELMKKLLN